MSPAPHPLPGPESCSVLSLDTDEPLAGTARHARAWLLIEQSGPWGSHALTESHLPRDIGRDIEARTDGTLVEPLLIRRPGRHADAHHGGERAVFVASVAPDRRWVHRWVVDNDDDLATWVRTFDPESVASGQPPSGGALWSSPLLALCTHAKRDLCCALRGRALLDELRTSATQPVSEWLWECSHLGGHRFSPTALALPSGLVIGRADAADCIAALDGEVPFDHARGLSGLEPAAQVADLAVRSALGGPGRTARLTTTVHAVADAAAAHRSAQASRWRVEQESGPSWIVEVESHQGSARPPSCGKVDETPDVLIARSPIPAS